MIYNNNLTIIYPPGAGGEFLGWAISIFPGFNQVSLNGVTEKNKWMWNTEIHGKGISMDNVDRVNHEFENNNNINVNRDHGECLFNRLYIPKSIDTFMNIYYDRWNTAGFIVIMDKNRISQKLAIIKNNSFTNTHDYILERFGNRKFINIDMDEILINDDVSEKIEKFIYDVFNVSINSSVLQWLIDAWNTRNMTIPTK